MTLSDHQGQSPTASLFSVTFPTAVQQMTTFQLLQGVMWFLRDS